MPIKPERRKLYPSNWKEIANRIKTEANWKCQQCDRPCRMPGEGLDSFIERIMGIPHPDLDWINQIAASTILEKPQKFTLTVAHLNHLPWDCSDANLKALCSGCHLRYDAQHHAINAAASRARRRESNGQLSLI